MNETLKKLIQEEENKLKRHKYLDSEEIAEIEFRISEYKRLWKKLKDNPFIQEMTKLVEKYVERYQADFYYWDLKLIEAYEDRRFAWFVGDCGTHFVPLDVLNKEEELKYSSYLDTVSKYYSDYYLYEINPKEMTIKKTKANDLKFQIIKPVG